MSEQKILNVAIIGAGEVTQVVHVPTFGYLSDYFKISYLCDVSKEALAFVGKRVNGFSKDIKITTDVSEVYNDKSVDLVVIATANEYHADYGVGALKADKHVLIEKPMAVTEAEAKLLIEAEKSSKGKVFVAYMRRLAPAFELAIKEIGGIDKIQFVRVRDIIGPNSAFVNQSGSYPKRFNDLSKELSDALEIKSAELYDQAITTEAGLPECGQFEKHAWAFLGGLGSHDLSLMREALGMPKGYIGAKCVFPYINALLDYGDFVVSYESGVHNIPEFDAHLEVYSANKIVKVQYDTPYVRCLPITLQVRENVDGQYVTRTVRPTYEDPYYFQARKIYRSIVEGENHKTTAEDSLLDLQIFRGILKASYANKSSN